MSRVTIRAALTILIMILAASSAGSAECPETKAVMVTAVSDFPMQKAVIRPDLLGKKFHVESPRGRSRGWDRSLTLVSGKERITLGLSQNPGTTPAVGFSSWAEGDKEAPRGRATPPVKTAIDEYAYAVQEGPLTGMKLSVARCER
ncbi:hypothetical protein [Methylobacterium nigriterrae]|uniref:hypothetical protein n=1 Tax=Methylobacterium nigriterrae TaxID=3127512 RepID=UPI00301406B5